MGIGGSGGKNMDTFKALNFNCVTDLFAKQIIYPFNGAGITYDFEESHAFPFVTGGLKVNFLLKQNDKNLRN